MLRVGSCVRGHCCPNKRQKQPGFFEEIKREILTPTRLERITFRSGVERATNYAMGPHFLICA